MCEGPHPYIPVPATVKADIVMLYQGETMVNSYYFSRDGGWDVPSMELLAGALGTGWASTLAPFYSTEVEHQLVRVTDLSSETGPVVEYFGQSGALGSDGGNPTSGNVALAVKFGTAQRGRSRRGRIFWGGMTETVVAGNQVTSAYRDDLIVALGTYIGGAITAVTDSEHVVVSLCAEGEWRSIGVVTPVTGITADLFVDSQRRRLAGRGV